MSSQITHHTLRITEPQISLPFYQNKLGMTLFAHRTQVHAHGVDHHYFLGFSESEEHIQNRNDWVRPPLTLLELVHQPNQAIRNDRTRSTDQDGYWKIGVTLKEVDLARQSLVDTGVHVSPAKQFLDIGYLCHLSDPDGYCIELLQHRFAQNHQPSQPQMKYALKSQPRLGQITLRVKDPETSLQFYIERLEMRLLSRQIVEPYRFTLYFLACTSEEPPFNDIDDVRNREWLWQRPYTLLELQHIWGTEHGGFAYRVSPDTGFYRISFALRGMDRLINTLVDWGVNVKTPKQFDPILQTETMTVFDPDGYSIRLIELNP